MPKINVVEMFRKSDPSQTAAEHKRNMALSDALMNPKGQLPPVYNAAQGAVSQAPKILGALIGRMSEDDEKAAEEAAWNPIVASMNGGTTGAGPSSSPSMGADNSGGFGEVTGSPAPASGDEVRSNNRTKEGQVFAAKAHSIFKELGYSDAAATGIIGNLAEESGHFDPAVIQGRRTGDNGTAFGIAQWRGERFQNLQRFAKQNGRDWRDFETQVRFIDHEMKNGLDRGAGEAFKRLQVAERPDQAADAFMRLYERPSNEAAATSGPRRMAYAINLMKAVAGQGGAPQPGGSQVAGRAPDGTPIEVARAPARPIPGAPPVNAAAAGIPEAPPMPGNGSPAPVPASAGTTAPGGARSQPGSPAMGLPQVPAPDFTEIDRQLQMGMVMARNPRTRAMGLELYQSALQSKAALLREHRKMVYEAQSGEAKYRRERTDKRDDFELEQTAKEREFERENNGKMQEPYTLAPGSVRFQGGRKIAEVPPTPKGAGGRIVLPDGTVVETGDPKLTEGQSKDIGFYERGTGANDALAPYQDRLTGFAETYGGQIPLVGNYLKSEEYQQAQQAGKEFLAAILRKDSGGAITAEEMEQYGDIFLPQPGDKPGAMVQKEAARHRALTALYKGLGPAKALAAAAPKEFDGATLIRRRGDAKNAGKPAPEANKPVEPGEWEYDSATRQMRKVK